MNCKRQEGIKTGKFIKYMAGVMAAIMVVFGAFNVAYAADFGTVLNGASNEEIFQICYEGSAWNYSGSGYSCSWFKYKRGGRVIMSKIAKKEKVIGSVVDDIRWGDKYVTKFSWDNHLSTY